MVHTGKATIATATAAGSRIDAHCSQSETSSALTACAPLLPNARTQSIDRHEGNISASTLRVSLANGQPIWYEISATGPSFEVSTPCVHLTITQDEIIRNELEPDWDHYWVILEYLLDHSVQDGRNVSVVDLLSIASGRNMILDYGSSEKPRELRVYSKHNVISVIYTLQKPVNGLEYRT